MNWLWIGLAYVVLGTFALYWIYSDPLGQKQLSQQLSHTRFRMIGTVTLGFEVLIDIFHNSEIHTLKFFIDPESRYDFQNQLPEFIIRDNQMLPVCGILGTDLPILIQLYELQLGNAEAYDALMKKMLLPEDYRA